MQLTSEADMIWLCHLYSWIKRRVASDRVRRLNTIWTASNFLIGNIFSPAIYTRGPFIFTFIKKGIENIGLRYGARFVLALVLASGSLPGFSQIPHFNSQDLRKILDTRVSIIDQDSLGFIWLGTERGLYRYDGNKYELMSSGDSVGSQHVTSIFCQGEQVWYGCQNGRIYYLEEEGPVAYDPEEGIPQVAITGLAMDKTGRLWYSTYGEGVYVQDERHVYNLDVEDGLLENQIYQMAMDNQGNIWIATDNGVSICQYENGLKKIKNLSRADGLQDEIVYTLTPHSTGMWLGFQSGGFCHYSQTLDTIDFFTREWDFGSVRSISEGAGSTLWIGTEDHGVINTEVNFNSGAHHSVVLAEFDGRECQQLMHDQAGNVWLVLDHQYLYHGVGNIHLLMHNLGDVQAVCESAEKQVWIGTQHGLYELKESQLVETVWHRENIISLYADKFGKIWIGTFGDGIICWDPKTNRHRRLSESEGLINGSIFSIDGFKDRLWLATLGGIVEVVNNEKILEASRIRYTNLQTSDGLNANFFYKVFVDRDGTVWFGTDGQGVIQLKNGLASNLLNEGLLPLKTAYSIDQDDFGNIWFGTNDEGVYTFNGHAFDHMGLEQGLSNLSITSIATDRMGHVIMVHENGVDLYDPVSKTFRYYDENTGLDKLNPGLNALSKGDGKTIWIGGQNLLVRYLIDENIVRTYPSLAFDHVRLFNDPINFQKVHEFGYNENFIQFDYVGIWHAAPQNINYEYRLDGYDIDWRETRDQSLSYSKLNPGSYRFKVRCLINDQPVLPSEISYEFSIRMPYWRRAWFLTLLGLTSIGIIYAYQRYREKRINLRAAMERERIESQYEVLKAQINPHFLFNSFNTLASIVEEDAELAVEYIEKLSDYYRSIIQFRNQKLIPLEDEMVLIDDFTYLLKKRFGKNLIVQKDVNDTDFYIPPLTLQMLVENAVKHNVISRQKPLTISIRSKNDAYLVVENNLQPKKTHEPSTKFGLQNIKTRFKLLSKDEVIILETDDTFSVSIPLIKYNSNIR